jgi:hypothetical protein
LLDFSATAIFDAMRFPAGSTPPNVTFVDAFTDYFQDADFDNLALAPLAPVLNTTVDRNENRVVIRRGTIDVARSASRGLLKVTVTDARGQPQTNARVVATQNGVEVQTVTTDASGIAILAQVPPGATTITAVVGLAEANQTLTIRAGEEFSRALTLTSQPRLLVSSSGTNAVLSYDAQTGAFRNIFVPPDGRVLDGPDSLVFGPDGNLYASSLGSRAIVRYDGRTGAFLNTFVPPGSGGLFRPDGLVFFLPSLRQEHVLTARWSVSTVTRRVQLWTMPAEGRRYRHV